MSGPILLLPGLGADEGLFAPQLEAFDNAVVPSWNWGPQVRTVDDLACAQLRYAIESGLWGPGVVLVGFSFGGQVALSMARAAVGDTRIDTPRAIVLISSPRRPEQLTRVFRAQVGLSRVIPAPLIGWAARTLVAPRFARQCALNDTQTADLVAMSRRLDATLFKRLARAATDWQHAEAHERRILDAGVSIAHLHSERDFVIPPPPDDAPGVELIPERAHLLTWTHAERVEALIRRVSD